MLLLSRHQALVVTSVVVSVRVAEAFVWLRHVLREAGVVTAGPCRDLLISLYLMSRPSVLCNCCSDSLLTSPLNSLYFDVAAS